MQRASTTVNRLSLDPVGWLAATGNSDGGWGARPGGPSTTEATSLALLALATDSTDDSSHRGLAWLRAHQRTDGAWPASDQVPQASWMTPLAVLAMGRFPSTRAQAVKGARWLVEQEGRGYSILTKILLRVFPKRDVVELDPSLTGWPWMADTFSWVEPTAYAMLALKSMRAALPGEPVAARLAEGERMLFDRMCAGGGWNYGNSRVMDEELWPYPDTTALALLALQDVPARTETRASLAVLRAMIEENDSGLALSLAVLCLRAYGEDASRLRARLTGRLDAIESFGETRSMALAALALADSTSPFDLRAPVGR